MARDPLTRPERALFLGVAMVITSIMGAVIWQIQKNRVRQMVMRDFLAVESAVLAFDKKYQRLPSRFADKFFDYHYGLRNGESNNEVMNALQGIDGPGNEAHALNPEQKQFIAFEKAAYRRSGLNRAGELVDPWGQPYQMVLDLDNDNICDVGEATTYDRAKAKRVAIWSLGPDGKSNTPDDILGWNCFR